MIEPFLDAAIPRWGDWMVTASGRQVWPLDPRPGDFTIADIAHGLSHACRYAGHCHTFYSVAQHSCLVSLIVEGIYPFPSSGFRQGDVEKDLRRWALVGLLHDASESFIGDMVRPLKRNLPEYQKIEKRMMEAIFTTFGLDPEAWDRELIHRADKMALLTERRDLLTNPFPHGSTWKEDEEGYKPWPVNITALDPIRAREKFLRRYAELTS